MGIIKKLEITPGPWEVKEEDYDMYTNIIPHKHDIRGWRYYLDKNGRNMSTEEYSKTKTANGKLITVAPDMLEALEKIIKAVYDENSTLANLNGQIINARKMLIEKFPEIKGLI